MRKGVKDSIYAIFWLGAMSIGLLVCIILKEVFW